MDWESLVTFSANSSSHSQSKTIDLIPVNIVKNRRQCLHTCSATRLEQSFDICRHFYFLVCVQTPARYSGLATFLAVPRAAVGDQAAWHSHLLLWGCKPQSFLPRCNPMADAGKRGVTWLQCSRNNFAGKEAVRKVSYCNSSCFRYGQKA